MLNKKGQFSIIAALLVAVVLVGASVTCYSAIRYSLSQDQQPQIVSSIDETNLGLKEILGFTVGYYGSVLKVTGNRTYAQQLATDYLRSGLNNLGQIKPDWGLSFELVSMTVNSSWFSKQSFSQGSLSVNYNLTGKGIYGASYTTSTQLDVDIAPSDQTNQTQLRILRDDGQPLINLGKSNLKFYNYDYEASIWDLTEPKNIASYANGTYILDLPDGLTSNAYVLEVSDTRGLMVLAASFSQFTTTLTWNSTNIDPYVYFVDNNSSDIDASPNKGTQNDFEAQKNIDGIFDTLSQAVFDVDNVTFVDSNTATGNNPTSGSFTLPSGWVNGDVAVFWWYTRTSSKTFVPTGNEITIKYNVPSSGYGRIVIGYRTLQNGDGSFSWTSSDSSSSTTVWGVSVFRNVFNIGDPFEADSGTPTIFTNINNPNPPAATVTTIGSAVLTIYGKNDDSSISAPSGYALCGSGSSTSGNDASSATAYRPNRPTGSEDPSVWSLGTAGNGFVWTGVLKAIQHTCRLDIEEQWVNVNASIQRQDLCIRTGSFSSETLNVEIWNEGSWNYLMTLHPDKWNNASLAPYINSPTLTIRFGSNDTVDPIQDSWEIEAVYIKPQRDVSFLVNYQQDSTFTLEVLQNGTMRWLGQNMEVTTQTIPIPPMPVKAIHVNQTIGGVNQEVPFQIEDWASDYQIPLGLTSNATIFGNRQMIVFLLNYSVSDFTIWWDGYDDANQTAMAYTNNYFTNPSAGVINNGRIQLQFSDEGFTLTSTAGSVTSTTNLMRINNREDTGGPELAYVILNGIVRAIVLGEAEYDNGVANAPNTYTNVIITLPADTNYFTYRLRYTFTDTTRTRSISDLCPVRVSTNLGQVQAQTENGTIAGFPRLQNGTGGIDSFINYVSPNWTPHHFSQLISDSGKGAGIMFTDIENQRLYSFDKFSGSTSKGAFRTSTGLLEVLPVSQSQVQFQYAYDITWQGAVATFDGTTPVCALYDDTTPMGLWLLAEYPPVLTLTAKS